MSDEKIAELNKALQAKDSWMQNNAENNLRPGVGFITDSEVSYENDPISKVLGKSRFTKKQQSEYAARTRARILNSIQEMAKVLHLDNVEIVTDSSLLEGKKAKAKGFYNKRTGKITIVVPNHASVHDAQLTLLHEAVAHYGLRKLFGNNFDIFLDNVYNNAEEEVRRSINQLAAKHGWDFRKATGCLRGIISI